jgi:purine nucleoside permease
LPLLIFGLTQAEEGGSSMQNIFETVLSTTRYVLTGASVLAGAAFAGPAWADHDGRPVKIMIINMFGGPAPSEASAFTGNLNLTEATFAVSRLIIPIFCATPTTFAR